MSSASDTDTVFVPDPTALPARRLVASAAPAERDAAAGSFAQLLAQYREIEARFGLAANDVAGAVAAFLAGNYMAYRDAEFPDAAFVPLVQQMRAVIAAQPRFRDASEAEKQQLYEEMAVVGMQMAQQRALLRTSGSASERTALRRTAKAHLDQFLQLDASRLRIGAKGIALQ